MIIKAEHTQHIETMCRKWFWFFCQSMMPPEWYDEKFHRELCEFLQFGGNKKIVILPRAHLKTTIASEFYTLWKASCDVNYRSLIVSNTAPNAAKTVHSIKGHVENSQFYAGVFADRIPMFNKTRWSDSCACLARPVDFPEGTFESAGVGSNIIRRHFNMIVEDDTIAPKKDDLTGEECMPSREDIEKAVGFHKLTPPLMINENDENLIVGTRWTDYDHIKWVIDNEKDYRVFNRAATLDGQIDGEPRYKRFSAKRLKSIHNTMGTQMFNALYLNDPQSLASMSFKPEWISYYEEGELPNIEELETIITWDPADPPTGKSSQDYSAIIVCSHHKSGVYVRAYTRDRITDKQGIEECFRLADQYGASKIRVEVDRYAYLETAIREEMKLKNKYYVIDALKTRGRNKNGRIRMKLSPLFENRVIKTKKGMGSLEQELFTFPNGAHDDIIDALTWQFLDRVGTEYEVESAEKGERSGEISFESMLDSLPGVKARGKYPFQRQLGSFNFSGFSISKN